MLSSDATAVTCTIAACFCENGSRRATLCRASRCARPSTPTLARSQVVCVAPLYSLSTAMRYPLPLSAFFQVCFRFEPDGFFSNFLFLRCAQSRDICELLCIKRACVMASFRLLFVSVSFLAKLPQLSDAHMGRASVPGQSRLQPKPASSYGRMCVAQQHSPTFAGTPRACRNDCRRPTPLTSDTLTGNRDV